MIDIQQQEYLTFAKAALLMGCSRQYVYKLVNEGKLAASRISSRMAFIRKADIEEMLASHPYHRVLPTCRPKIPKAPSKTEKNSIKAAEQDASVLDCISGEEVMRIYKVKKSWLYTSAKNNQVPICRIGGRNYYSRKHMDLLFSLTVEASEVKEWVTAKEAEELYGIKPGSLHACAYRHHIPTKREYGQTYYAKDLLRTETEVWEIGAETGVEYLKKLGLDVVEGVAENIEDVAATTACLFFGFLDGATNISETCDGGGGNNELPKKKDDEDELSFAKRCHQMTRDMHAPRPQLRKGRS